MGRLPNGSYILLKTPSRLYKSQAYHEGVGLRALIMLVIFLAKRLTGYSGHSTRDRMVSALEDIMGEAKNEYEASMISDAIAYIQNRR